MSASSMLKRIFAAITIRADQDANHRDLKKLVVLGAREAKRGSLPGTLDGIASIAEHHETETSTWVEPDAITTGAGGVFDACDLRHWLAIAERAGVPFIPAREVLRLTEAEASFASGQMQVPPTLSRSLLERFAKTLGAAPAPDEPAIDASALEEKLFSAMDEVPDGWMVRHIRSGGSMLKSFAGLGHAGESAPEVRLTNHLEVGPGWVRIGNRRRIDMADRRTVKAYAEGPAGRDCIFLARPWIEAGRYLEAEDPHRADSPFAGKGLWPAEYRVFIRNGEIAGVSAYYPWASKATREDARSALAARDLAARMLAEMKAIGAIPRYMDLEFGRRAAAAHGEAELSARLEERWPADGIHCTLDFLETKDGLVLLEGGPGTTPFGGGHVCGFAGQSGPPLIGAELATEGVALALLDGVSLIDMKSWQPSDPKGRILTFAEAEALAASNT